MQYVHFSANISQQSINQLVEVFHKCAANDDPDICLLFYSEGGGIWPGQHAQTLMQSYPGEISICNVGVAYSSAVSMFLAAEDRSCSPAATFAFHSIYRTYDGGVSLNAKEAALITAANEIQMTAMIEWVATRTSLDQATIAELCASRYPVLKDAQWALDNGFVTKIENPSIDPSKPMHFIK